jgi:hypothetical protein
LWRHPLRIQGRSRSAFESVAFGGRLHGKPRRGFQDLQRILVRFKTQIGFGETEIREVLRLEIGAIGWYRDTWLRSLLDGASQESGCSVSLAVPERPIAIGVQLVPFLSCGAAGHQARKYQRRDERERAP